MTAVNVTFGVLYLKFTGVGLPAAELSVSSLF
jgi:hypothetical protein